MRILGNLHDHRSFLLLVCLFIFISVRQSRGHVSHDGESHKKFERDILFGENEADDYKDLPDEEKAAKLRVLAEKMDKNKDRYVSEQELQGWIEINHIQYIVSRSKKFFEETDTDNDNFVTFQEYEKSQYEAAPGGYTNTTLYRHEKRRFGYADTDKNNKLSLQEFVYFLNPEEGKHMLDAIVEESIDNMDMDGDHQISIKDFIGERILSMTREEFLKSVKDFKENLDKDQNALLDRDEMRAWISSDRRSTATEEVKHMMEHGDADKDGQLSYDEVTAMGRELETSRATQYGELLDELEIKQEL